MNDLPQQIGCLIRKQRSDKKNSQEKLALLCISIVAMEIELSAERSTLP